MPTLTYTAFVTEAEDGKVVAEALIPRRPWFPILSCLGRNRAEALAQLRVGLKTHLRLEGWLPQPFPLVDPQVLRVAVDLRPGWRDGERYYSGDRSYRLEVSCVHGEVADGDGLLAVLPRLGVAFYFFDKDQLKETIRNEVQKVFIEAAPEEIARFLPEAVEDIDAVSASVPEARIRRDEPPDDSVLASVAERLSPRVIKRKMGAAYEREEAVAAIQAAIREAVPGLLIVGEAGTGKTCVAYEAFRRLTRRPKAERQAGAAPPRIYGTTGGRLIAGMRYLGEWEQRVRQVCEEASASDVVLYGGELVAFLTAGRSGEGGRGIDVIVRPYLERSEMRLVLEATPRALDAAERLSPGFTDLFKVVRLEPTDAVTTSEVIARVLNEKRPGQEPPPELLITTILDLGRRFLPRGAFPGKVIPFSRELAPQTREAPFPSRHEVVDAFSLKTGIPALFLDDEVPLAPEEVAEFFAGKLVGQDAARDVAVSLVSTLKAGLQDPSRPIASLLLCGPTGVGKTELAKCLAEFFFSGRERLIRLDMSEYALPGSLSRLVGDLHLGPGELTRRISDQPFSVVLLDEVEKADPAVFDVLMGLFDEGRLTDPFGKVADFRSAIVVMTSNLGAQRGAELGFAGDAGLQAESRVLGAVAEFFRPEFLNRIDRVVVFEPLGQAQCLEITRRELARLERREGFERRRIKLRFSEDLIRAVADAGFDARYGARPLKRAIDRLITSPLARRLATDPELGGLTLSLDWRDGRLASDAL